MAPTTDHPIFKTFGYSAATKLLNDGSRLAANGEVMHFETRKHLICIYNNPLASFVNIVYAVSRIRISLTFFHSWRAFDIRAGSLSFIKSPFMSVEMICDYFELCIPVKIKQNNQLYQIKEHLGRIKCVITSSKGGDFM